jgi:hypothetical protein
MAESRTNKSEGAQPVKKAFAQIALLFLLFAFCVMAVVLVRQVLQLQFGPTNDHLHKRGSAFTLDWFIPAGTISPVP